jgi:hypothetical protein
MSKRAISEERFPGRALKDPDEGKFKEVVMERRIMD